MKIRTSSRGGRASCLTSGRAVDAGLRASKMQRSFLQVPDCILARPNNDRKPTSSCLHYALNSVSTEPQITKQLCFFKWPNFRAPTCSCILLTAPPIATKSHTIGQSVSHVITTSPRSGTFDRLKAPHDGVPRYVRLNRLTPDAFIRTVYPSKRGAPDTDQ